MGRPFVGRARELAELGDGLAEARTGRGSLFLLVGEPGIGKTRLADEFSAAASAAGAGVHWGRCWEAGGAPPYWPWSQLLRPIVAEDPTVLGPRPAELGQILPELGGEAAGGDPGSARFRLFDATLGLLRRAAAAHPRVLVLDDLHAADEASLRLLQFLARELRGVGLLVIGTYRDLEARLAGHIGELLTRIAREGAHFPLGRLGRAEVAELVGHSGGTDAASERVFATSEGNPLFVSELCQLLHASEPSGAIPDSIQHTIRARLDLIEPGARALLEIASVLGREVVPARLARLAETPAEEIHERLAPALQANLLAELESGRQRFTHVLVREVLYGGLPAARRAALHARALAVLDDGTADPSTLAHHALAAVPALPIEAAIDQVLRAASGELRRLAFEDAASLAERGLGALTLAEAASGPELRIELLLRLGQAGLLAGDHARGGRACDEAAQLARRLGRGDLLARAALTLGAEFVPGMVRQGLVDLLGEALAGLPEGDGALRARVMARLAAAIQPAPDPELPMAQARAAIAMARRLDDREVLRAVLFSASSALADYAPGRERAALDREAVELATAAGDRAQAFRSHLRLVFDHVETGELGLADDALRACGELAAQFASPKYAWPVVLGRSMRAEMRADLALADRLADEAFELAAHADEPTAPLVRAMNLAGRAVGRQDRARLLDLEGRFAELMPTIPSGTMFALLMRAFLCARAFERERTGRLLDQIDLTDARLLGEPMAGIAIAEAAALIGDRHAAEVALGILASYADRLSSWGMVAFVCDGVLARILGALEHLLGGGDAARAKLAGALERARTLAMPTEEARAHASLAAALAADGQVDRARAHWTAAATIAERLGMSALAAHVGEHLAPGTGTGTGTRPAPDFSLTREGEIWTVRHGAQVARLRDSRGLQLLALLIAQPGVEHHALALSAPPGQPTHDLGDAGAALDREAIAAYRDRARELEAELAQAEAWNDAGRVAGLRDELERIGEELSRGVGLGGRARRAGSAAERARVNVQRRIRDAIARIEEALPELGRYLGWTVKTGTFCRFDPGP